MDDRDSSSTRSPNRPSPAGKRKGESVEAQPENSRRHRSREEDTRFEGIFQNSQDILVIVDSLTGDVLDANPALQRILFYEPPAIIGRHFSVLYPPDQPVKREELRTRIAVHGGVFESVHLLDAHGELIPMDLTAMLMPWNGGEAILAMYRDVREREFALRQLRESEERYRLLAQNSLTGIFIDQEGRLEFANERLAAMTGYSLAELMEMSIWDIVHPHHRVMARQFDKDHITRIHEPLRREFRYMRKDGEVRWAELLASVTTYRDRPAVMGNVADITERKRHEEELLQAHQQLELRVSERTRDLVSANERLAEEILQRTLAEDRIQKSLDEKEVLIREIHHRVKNNLQVISSLLALQGSYFFDEKVLGALNDSQNRVRSMALIHEQLYESSDLARIDFAGYLRSLTASLIQSYSRGNQSITLNLKADRVDLELESAIPCGLIINELVSNCLKHAFDPRQQGNITVEVHNRGDVEYVLVVADNGKGLPPDFDYRGAKSLGLRLVTSLAESQLHGTIAVRIDGGTSFTIVFPARERRKGGSD